MLFYCKLTKALLSYSFALNPYDPCVVNKMVNGEQLTICWHVDDLKSSHIDPKVNDEFLQWIEDMFGQLSEVKTHGCEEILIGNCKPEKDIDSVFNQVLQSDIGKTIVRKYAPTLNAQAVWKDFESHMSTSFKGQMKGIDYMYMYPQLSMTGLGNALLNNLFSTSMNNLGN